MNSQKGESKCCQQKIGRNFRLLILTISLSIYLILGALIFSALESSKESAEVAKVKEMRKNFASEVQACVSDEQLEAFILAVIEANDGGVPASRNVTFEPNWSFGQSVFFTGTLLTTVGYGHNRPLSHSGKVFCIFYIMFGLPLTLTFLSAAVHRLLIPAGWLLTFLQRKMEYVTRDFHIHLLHLSIITMALFIFFFLIPAAIFAHIEADWDIMDGLYYCFISLTTIGLGDYIPGEHPEQKDRATYKIAVTVYLYLGLMCMMALLAITYNIKELNLANHFILEGDNKDAEKKQLTTDSQGTYSSEEQTTPKIEEGQKDDPQ